MGRTPDKPQVQLLVGGAGLADGRSLVAIHPTRTADGIAGAILHDTTHQFPGECSTLGGHDGSVGCDGPHTDLSSRIACGLRPVSYTPLPLPAIYSV